MAPSPVTQDPYAVLEVDRDATTEEITKAYRRLALKTHPDKNNDADSTQAFQRLQNAYDTIGDETSRQQYEEDSAEPQYTPREPSCGCGRHHHAPSEEQREIQEVLALLMTKANLTARWKLQREALTKSVNELRRSIQRLQGDIEVLAKAGIPRKSERNGWPMPGKWPDPKKAGVEDSGGDSKAARTRQAKVTEMEVKEHQLDEQQAKFQEQQASLMRAQRQFEYDIAINKEKIAAVEARAMARMKREDEELDEMRRAYWAEMRQAEQEKRERDAKEAREFLRRQHDALKAEEKVRQEKIAAQQAALKAEKDKRFADTSGCSHIGRWDSLQGGKSCPVCSSKCGKFLLQCPGCKRKACRKCQRELQERAAAKMD